jgi:tetratricopeptide (TPR) repeat protein
MVFAMMLILCASSFVFAQHDVGGGSTVGGGSIDTGRIASPRVRRAPAAGPRRPRPATPVRRGATAEQLNQEGDTLFDDQSYNDALDAYTKAVQLKPIASAYYHIGWIYNDRADYDSALSALQQAVRLNPNYATALDELAYTYRSLKRYDDAFFAYRKAVSIDPTFAKAWYDMGWTYNDMNRYAEAERPLKQAILLQADYAEAYNELGYAYRKLKRSQEAISAYRRAVSLRMSTPAPTSVWETFTSTIRISIARRRRRTAARWRSSLITPLLHTIWAGLTTICSNIRKRSSPSRKQSV